MTDLKSWTLVISLVGAAAWLPHLVTLAIKVFRKPKLTLTPARTCQLGYTELGPIFNIKAALTAEHESILIDKIEFSLRHESGDKHLFRWHEITEVKGQMVVPGVQTQPIYQESEAIAIKILPTDFKDLLFRNRLEPHTQGLKKYEYAFDRERRRLVNAGQYDSDKFYASSYTQDMQAFLQSQMIWKKGRYEVTVTLHNRNKAASDLPTLTFELEDEDIVLLQANCNNMPKLLKNMCLTEQEMEKRGAAIEWHWLNKDVSTVAA
jgi:hypothetical protein